jgi:ATP-binding cassette subfamily F protein 3
MLHLHELSLDFAGRVIFAGVTWHLGKNDRVGLVGENGAGKSTLMRLIDCQMEPTSGRIHRARGGSVGYLPQEGIVTRGRTLFIEAQSALAHLMTLGEQIEEGAAQLADMAADDPRHGQLLERLGQQQEEFRNAGGYSMEAEVGRVLEGLGFSRSDWERECGEFSGGWQMRIALARLLLARPSVLLLDEPTNHLDMEARNWLEEYLSAYPGAVMVVSHDRFFLDRVCPRITEVWNGSLTDYHCSYSRYLVLREERVSALREAKARQDEEIARTEEFIARFRAKADKASLVQSRIRQLEKIERILVPPERKKIRFRFPSPPRSGRIVMELAGVSRAYGDQVVLREVSLTLERGERVALVGHNGAGKSTLMGVLAGGPLQAGSRTLGHNVITDYFAQDQGSVLAGERTVWEEILADAPFDTVPTLRNLLGAFLFTGDDVDKRVRVLSGGEKNRLALAKMLLRPANLLLLDEPTNHLDLFSKDVLLDALLSYEGTLVFVSHDRYFVDALATRVVEVANGGLGSYPGSYEEYLARKGGEALLQASAGVIERTRGGSSLPGGAVPGSKEERLRQREEEKARQREERTRQRRLAELEEAIQAKERELAELESRMGEAGFFDDPVRGAAAGERHGTLAREIEALYGEWDSLEA